MKTKSLLFAALSIALTTGFTTAQATEITPLNPGVTLTQMVNRQPIDWVSVDQIAQSLKGKPPMNVGFDVDDTVLFSSPEFFRGQQVFSPNSNAYLHNPAFWEKANNAWAYFSLPKESMQKVIDMHIKRGDHIYFITGRPASKTEDLTKIIEMDYHIPAKDMHKVIFAGSAKGKIPYMRKLDIKLYYGDATTDISDAHAVGAEGIRVIRPTNSTYKPLPKMGCLGEPVLINSQY